MRVAIIHPWFPQYRREFFDSLHKKAQAAGINVDVYYGAPPPELSSRGDSTSSAFATELATRYWKISSRSVGYKSLKSLRKSGPYDLIIMEQAVRNLETYAIMVQRMAPHIAFWGHGRTYTKTVGKVQEELKMRLTMRGDWFFAYTQGGADHVQMAGFPRDATTVVNNAIDSTSLSSSIELVSDMDVLRFKKMHNIVGPMALFIGGLDESKRLEFLIQAFQRAQEKVQDFSLVVAGKGPEEGVVTESARRNNSVKYIGSIFGAEKAVAMKAADVLAMPGRVGLVAVDSFAAGLPIVTTNWEWHAPEFEYLTNGYNSIISADTVESFSDGLVQGILDSKLQQRLIEGCRVSAESYSVESMSTNFVEGLQSVRHRYVQ